MVLTDVTIRSSKIHCMVLIRMKPAIKQLASDIEFYAHEIIEGLQENGDIDITSSARIAISLENTLNQLLKARFEALYELGTVPPPEVSSSSLDLLL